MKRFVNQCANYVAFAAKKYVLFPVLGVGMLAALLSRILFYAEYYDLYSSYYRNWPYFSFSFLVPLLPLCCLLAAVLFFSRPKLRNILLYGALLLECGLAFYRLGDWKFWYVLSIIVFVLTPLVLYFIDCQQNGDCKLFSILAAVTVFLMSGFNYIRPLIVAFDGNGLSFFAGTFSAIAVSMFWAAYLILICAEAKPVAKRPKEKEPSSTEGYLLLLKKQHRKGQISEEAYQEILRNILQNELSADVQSKAEGGEASPSDDTTDASVL